MSKQDVVTLCNDQFRALKQRAEAEREKLLLILILDGLIRVTNSDEQNAQMDPPKILAVSDPTDEQIHVATASVNHKHVADIYGNCSICKACTHPRVGENGLCLQCGENVRSTSVRDYSARGAYPGLDRYTSCTHPHVIGNVCQDCGVTVVA